MGRLSALAAFVAVAALVAVYVARHEPTRRAPNRASAPAARDDTPSGKVTQPVPVRGAVRANGEPGAGIAVVIYRIPYIQREPYSVVGRRSTTSHVIDAMPDEVLARATADTEGRFACAVPRGAICAAVAAGAQRLFVAKGEEVELVLDLDPRRDVRLTFADPDGRPVEGARVLVYSVTATSPPVAQLVTDAAGSVVVALARWDEVVAFAPGLATTRVHWADPWEPEDRRVEMAWARRIAGRVRDTAGEPVAGAAVDVRRAGYSGITDPPPPWWRRVTGADGSFAFEGTRDGKHSVLVRKPGYTTEHAFVWPDEPAARFVLRRSGSVAGRVVLPDGAPAAGATVRWNGREPVQAAADGSFRLEDVPAGRLRVSAVRREEGRAAYRGAAFVDVPEGGTVDAPTLTLVAIVRSFVYYRTVDRRGEPVGASRIRTFGKPPGATVTLRVGGRPNVGEPGPLHATLIATTAANADEAEVVTVRLPDPVAVTVALRDEAGTPVAGTPNADLHSDGWIVDTRPGRVDLAANPEQALALTVDVAGFIRARVERPPPEGGMIEVVARRARCEVAGRIVAASGEPYRGNVWLRGDGRAVGRTEADGRFRLGGLGPGPATLFAGVKRELVLAPGRNDVGTIRMPAPVRVRGTVVDADGRPVWQATVRLHDRDTGRNAGRDPLMRTRGDGSFDVTVTPTLDYALRIDADGFATAFAPVAPEPRVVLRPDGTIVVHVSKELSKQSWAPGVRDARDRWLPRSTSRNDRREWTLKGVPPGRWEVFALRYGAPAPDLARPCTVVAGETTVVRFD